MKYKFDKKYHKYGEVAWSVWDTLPSNSLKEINNILNKLESNNFKEGIPRNQFLVGQIEKEYKLILPKKSIFRDYLNKTTIHILENNHQYYYEHVLKHFQAQNLKSYPSVEWGDLWVNYQEKYEYNPIHNHTGLMSFVVWYKIPFKNEEEKKVGPGKNKGAQQPNQNGNFYFVTAYGPGGQAREHNFDIDINYEGTIVFFPSNLMHGVYPFYSSDDYRISISGNLYLKT